MHLRRRRERVRQERVNEREGKGREEGEENTVLTTDSAQKPVHGKKGRGVSKRDENNSYSTGEKEVTKQRGARWRKGRKMYIEEICIDGFKSYAQRVTLSGFDQCFNAITGLNGIV